MTPLPRSAAVDGDLDFDAHAHDIVDRLGRMREAGQDARIVNRLPPDGADRLRALARPGPPRPVRSVIDDGEAILDYRVRAEHPRFFGFIPAPASPLSWLGDMLTTGCNPHAGNWLQSSGPSAIEDGLVAWLAERAGLPHTAGGSFVSGGSMANLTGLMIARDQKLDPEDRRRGVAYVSAQTHASVAKGLAVLGFLPDQVRKVAVDSRFRLDVDALAAAVRADRAAGLRPFAVVATCGTTNTGSIDPLNAIADLAQAEDLWMHVDGAYGASIVLSESHAHLARGLGRADSLAWDAHKWLFQTYGCGMVLVRDRRHLLQSFSMRPEYLRDADGSDAAPNFWDLGVELTRPARAMKLWFTLQVLGTAEIGRRIDHGFTLARTVETELRRRPHWRIVSPAQLAIVNFRYDPGHLDPDACDALNDAVAKRMIADNIAAPLTTRLNGRTVMRICAISPDASPNDMRAVAAALDERARLLCPAATAAGRKRPRSGPHPWPPSGATGPA